LHVSVFFRKKIIQPIVPSYNLATVGRQLPPPPISETVSLHISHQHRHSQFSDSVLRLFSSGASILT